MFEIPRPDHLLLMCLIDPCRSDTVSTMKALLQVGCDGRVPLKPEKRFPVSDQTNASYSLTYVLNALERLHSAFEPMARRRDYERIAAIRDPFYGRM
jgi:hypothetical protein